MNTHAVTLEQRFKRRVMSTFHALYSVGALAGSAIGGLMAQGHVKEIIQECSVSVLFAATRCEPSELEATAAFQTLEPSA